MENAPRRFCIRCLRPRRVCVSVSRVRRKASTTGSPVTDASEREISAAWLKCRCRRRAGWSGTGTSGQAPASAGASRGSAKASLANRPSSAARWISRPYFNRWIRSSVRSSRRVAGRANANANLRSLQFGQAKRPSIFPGNISPHDWQNGSAKRGRSVWQASHKARPWLRPVSHSAQLAG